MNARALVGLYLAVVLAPLALAALDARPPRGFRDELASGAGMLAFAILLVDFVLSGRFRTISRRVGMDVTMRFHQLMARLALGLAIVHPFLYEAPFLAHPLPWDTTRQLGLAYDLPGLAGGMLALVLLPAFVLGAIWRDQTGHSYETWRLLHGLGALLIAAGVLHHALSAGRYAEDPVLAWFWILMFAAAALTLAVVYLWRPLRLARRPWVLRSVTPAGERQWWLELAPAGHDGLDFRAGQFAWLTLGPSPFTLVEHPFSIASAPADRPALGFLVKELGDFTRGIGRLAPGTPAFVDGPHGHLVVEGHDAPGIAFIAGGIGIAPLFSILRELRARGDPRPTLLVYANRRAAQIALPEALDALALAHGTEVVHVLDEPGGPPCHRGRPDAALMAALVRDAGRTDWLFVICGPGAMIEAVEHALLALGVAPARILSERFRHD